MKSGFLSTERLWAFWAGAGLVAIGGVLPMVFGGTSSRVSGVIVPFWVAAGVFVVIGLLYNQGRTLTSILYFVAGLAIVFGLLSMFSLPLRLAVLGSCPALPAPCSTGLGRPLTDAENTGMGAASAFGIVALFIGFFGLATLYRRPVLPTSTPPVRRIPPMAPAATPKVDTGPADRPEAEPEPQPELPAHEASPPTT